MDAVATVTCTNGCQHGTNRKSCAEARAKCPGGAEYGHGMSLTSVHAGGCCEAARASAPICPCQCHDGMPVTEELLCAGCGMPKIRLECCGWTVHHFANPDATPPTDFMPTGDCVADRHAPDCKFLRYAPAC